MIKSKKLKRKAESALKKLQEVSECNGLEDLQFETQHWRVRDMLLCSINELQDFIDNIDKDYF